MHCLSPNRFRRAVGPVAVALAIAITLTSHVSAASTSGVDTPRAVTSDTVPALRTDAETPDPPVFVPRALRLTADADDVPRDGQRVAERRVDPFLALGVSWIGPAGETATVVVAFADGQRSAPFELHVHSTHGEDDTRDNAADGLVRHVSEPVALDRPAVGYLIELPTGPTDLRVHLVREDPSADPIRLGDGSVQRATADGIPGPSGIRTRESWGARPRKQTAGCAPGGQFEGLGCVARDGVRNAVVHHTVNANNYAASSVPTLLRSIQAFHQDAEEFDDIGYNFVVDRFGTIWETRAGGADRPVVGGHVKGFNTGSVGVAVLGTFDASAPTEAALDSVAQVIAWKFAMRNVDPFGQITLVSNGGDIYPEGESVTVNTIDGHRSIGATACPGAQLFARLGDIRQRVAALLPTVTGEVNGLDRFSGKLSLTGYALQRDNAAPVTVSLAIDGAVVGQTVANLPRDDVRARFGSIGANHGFAFVVPTAPNATGRACVTEVGTNTLIGCRDVNPPTPAFGDFGFTTTISPPRIGLSGWAVDPDSSEPTVAHVYLDGVFTQLWADKPRPDIATVYPGYGTNRGFAADFATTLGAHQLCVFAINVPSGAHTLLGCREVIVGTVNRTPPTGVLDVASAGGASVLVSGWALDRDTVDPLNVHVYVDNVLTPIVTSIPRPDVVTAYPGSALRSGFSARVAANPGVRTVCVYAIDANLVGPHALVGCRVVNVAAPNVTPPTGSLDLVAGRTGAIAVAGWAIDPDTTAPIAVHVYVDGSPTFLTASINRPDVGAAFPSSGSQHGFAATVPATPGFRHVCVYAINNLVTGAHTLLGCGTVMVS